MLDPINFSYSTVVETLCDQLVLALRSAAPLFEALPVTPRDHVGPFFGWLNAWLKPYPDTVSLKTMVHIRDSGIRPYIELQPTDHPLAVEQRNGITVERVAELYALMMHPVDK